MLSIGPEKLLFVFLIAALVLGPEKLPATARKIGKIMSELRRLAGEVQPHTLVDYLDNQTEHPAADKQP